MIFFTTIVFLCSLVFTDSEEKMRFVFFAQICHEKSIKKLFIFKIRIGFQNIIFDAKMPRNYCPSAFEQVQRVKICLLWEYYCWAMAMLPEIINTRRPARYPRLHPPSPKIQPSPNRLPDRAGKGLISRLSKVLHSPHIRQSDALNFYHCIYLVFLLFRSARASWNTSVRPSVRKKIWISYIQAYKPHESSEDSPNQRDGPLDPLGPPGPPIDSQ